MCGIFAYLGKKEAQPILLDGLKRLEYRGYDSSGIAIADGKKIEVVKKKGRIADLVHLLNSKQLHGRLGISHTRWATHGIPSDENAHPHFDQSRRLSLVHNGVIENYQLLKQRLLNFGHKFQSETDTEVLAHLIGHNYELEKAESDDPRQRLIRALKRSLKEISGTYGIALIHADVPNLLLGARRGSPLVLGIGNEEFFLSSDVTAICPYAHRVVYLNDGDLVAISPETFDIQSLNKSNNGFEIRDVDQLEMTASLKGFPHYMLKEIYDQPEAIRNAFRGRLNHEEATAKLGGLNMSPQELLRIERIQIIGCGSARHAGIVGEYLIESLAHIPVEVEFSSEFRYKNSPLDRHTVVFAVSQSGETADTLAAVKEAKRKGLKVLGICNRVGSSIARETEGGVFMHAGPEIAVAATKSFSSQVLIFSLLALLLGRLRFLSAREGHEIIEAIEALPDQVTEVLKLDSQVEQLAKKYVQCRRFLLFGRQFQYGVALEGALKIKEISYCCAEGNPSAELKHGIIALIDKTTPSICLCPRDGVYDKNISNMEEIKARGGPLIAIATENDDQVARIADDVLYIPKAPEYLSPILTVIPLQLFAYHLAVLLGRDVDKPRNLAKSVTVE
ncbi:glutamine--fructose-6-phosphate transaminase (isomerizing) [Candidatus Methylacidiphilum infernorum]|uniref:Glutamine--fructose-6-phosphate aminotransferase [isomerizing] n=1 Tax=Candidatus Methylacidiphilum infernorum TaxID=511746 RepID=A0ABX7PT46_9BACT|nr:glutamine--fructose-6-phosphate transaminase (isomerizing) [Candidatus Methylacidiphilum infernorum]QSR86134.1 glutamine--fructose-6-phosphate transaminase (isomerizing) [Candidatus Methylacidiphilum infernorum]